MAIQQEFFTKELQNKLHSDAAFLKTVADYSQYIEGRFIHIPNAGSSPSVSKNTSSFPLVAVSRVDTDLAVPTAMYNTDLIKLPEIEVGQLAYDKYASVIEDYNAALVEVIGNEALQSWVPSTNKRLVQNDASKFTFKDVSNLAKQLTLDKVPTTERFLALPTDMYYELMEDENVLRALNSGLGYSVVEGLEVVKLGGFNIYQRPQVAFATKAGASTTSECALAYHKNSLMQAQSAIKIRVNEDRAEYLGDIVVASVWFGSGVRRLDEAGVAALVRS